MTVKLPVSVGSITAGNIESVTEFVQHAEKLGVTYAWSHEAWGSDAATPLAYLTAKTSRMRLGCGVFQISARVPSMIAMTALTLDALSGGRFVLGLGASGPQVVEGLHEVAYNRPLSRLQETVDTVRLACRGEKLAYSGEYHELPRAGGEGSPLCFDLTLRPDLSTYLATLGPKALEYTGATANGWLGTLFSPEHAAAHMEHLQRDAETTGRKLTGIDLQVTCTVAIGDNVGALIPAREPAIAFAMGAMGSAKTNFYHDAYCRAGFAEDARAIQDLWLDGQREAAAARVPTEMVTQFSAVGTSAMVRERFAAYNSVGIDCLNVRFDGTPEAERCAVLEEVCAMVNSLG
jgi:F420-dependent oxidoreductase-like protein